MAEFHAVTPIRRGTERLIVTTSYSGAGHLKASRIADKVIDVHDTLVWGPVPAAPDPVAFFEAREAAYDSDPHFRDQLFEWDRATPATVEWQELLSACRAYERVELWIDPTPNEQLLFIQLLHGLSRHDDIVDKLFIVHADDRLAERSVPNIATMKPTIVRAGSSEIEISGRAWRAYGQSTPEAWFGLLESDLAALPWLRRTVLLLLGELPALDTALGATERLMIETVAPGAVKPARLMAFNAQENPARVFGTSEDTRILASLAGGDVPLILGLREAAFDFMEQDRERRERYMQSELSLSTLGRDLLEGRDDYSRHNAIHRWWGGTLLTNDRLWRWDAANQRLVAPC